MLAMRAPAGATSLLTVVMQEDPSTVPDGETPRSLLLYAFDTNVDAAKPGDKVTITGKQQWHYFLRQ